MKDYKGFYANTFTNLVSGLGTEKAKSSHTKFVADNYSIDELIIFYENNWLARKAINSSVDDMILGWRTACNIDKNLDVVSTVKEALIYERVTGGGLILFDDGDLNTEKPLSGEVKKLVALHIGEICEIKSVIADPASEYFGRPKYIEIEEVSKTGEIVEKKYHISRFHLFPFKQAFRKGGSFWRPSLLSTNYDLVSRTCVVLQMIEDFFYEKKTDTFKINGLMNMCSTDEGTDQLLKRFALNTQLKSLFNASLIDNEEELVTTELQLSGIKENILILFNAVSAAFDSPITKLFGMSPSGLNSTGESDLHNYYQSIEAKKATDIIPFLERLDIVTNYNDEWTISKSRTSSDTESSVIDEKNIATAIAASEYLPDTAIIRFINEKTSFNLTDEEIRSMLGAYADT